MGKIIDDPNDHTSYVKLIFINSVLRNRIKTKKIEEW